MFIDTIREVLGYEYFGADQVLPYNFEPAEDSCRMLVVTGENATGKSFFRQVLRSHLFTVEKPKHQQMEVLDIGMHRRTTEGMERAFIFGGSDRDNSTGTLSINSILGALRTAADREHPVWLILDEPDVGLSESYGRAMGEFIATRTAELGEHVQGVMVVSHSRMLVEEMLRRGPAHLLRMGADSSTTAWLQGQSVHRSIEDLLDLRETNRALRNKINTRRQNKTAKNC